jgi:Zn-dependent protease
MMDGTALVSEVPVFAIAIFRWLFPFFRGAAVGLLAMVIHECAHLAMASLLGVRIKHVGMQWNKGLFTVRESGTLHQNLLITLAGPSINAMLVATGPWLPIFSMANFCYALANMLPIEGSDGFRVAECWRRLREHRIVG